MNDLLIAIIAGVVLIALVEIIFSRIKYPQNEILETPEFQSHQEKLEAGYVSQCSIEEKYVDIEPTKLTEIKAASVKPIEKQYFQTLLKQDLPPKENS